ncbi:MAG: TlpA disulfide reductase family protein [Pseudomonadota bacterium]
MKIKTLATYLAVATLFGALGAYAGMTGPGADKGADKSAAPPDGPASLFAQSLPDAQGKAHALSQYKGKALLVNFWAPWCGPCVKEMPELSALAAQYPKVQIIGIGIDSPSNIAEFTGKFKIAYPLFVAGMGGSELARQFGDNAGSLPFTALIGADGKVRKTYMGTLKFAQLKADLGAL